MALPTPIIAAHYAEIALKGKNRPMFLRRLINNIRAALRDESPCRIDHIESRLLVHLPDPDRAEEVLVKLRRVFGIQWLSPVVPVPRDSLVDNLDSLSEVAATLALQDRGDARNFKVETRRSDRNFRLPSPEINRIVGGAVQQVIGLPARMTRPDFTLHVLILKDHALVFTRKIRGYGGLPSGSAGAVGVLLSGGIDSPVAAWMMMKRGCRPHFVHFYSGRSVAEADVDKIEVLVGILARYSPHPLNLQLLPVYPYELRAIGQVRDAFDMVLFRRFMVKCAERLARRRSCLGLVTGDSLGQVASQTLHNMAAISPDVELPIYRPLIGLDKYEITEMATRIGTFDTSIEPYRDCCSIRSPHPVLKADASELLRLSEIVDLDSAVVEAVDGATSLNVGPLAGGTS